MPRTPGLLLLIADDWSPLAGCYGTSGLHTPHVDRLAGRAVRFDAAHCTTPSCAASRATLLTGLHSHQHGQYGHCHGRHGFSTHADVDSLATLLQRAGVPSALIGKRHVAPASVYPFSHGEQASPWEIAPAADRLAGFLGGAAGRPFFATVASLYPHRTGADFDAAIGDDLARDDAPLDPDAADLPGFLPDTPAVRGEYAAYLRFVRRFDRFVGAMLRVLEESGRGDDTLVLLLSDHGMPFPGAKASPSQAGHRCPLFAAAPGGAAGACGRVVDWTDVYPTAREWLGLPEPADGFPRVGRSLLPLLTDPSAEHRPHAFFSHQTHEVTNFWPYRAALGPRHKLVRHLRPEVLLPMPTDLFDSTTFAEVRRLGLEQAVRRFPEEALYDLEADPWERHNLIDDPALAPAADALRAALLGFRLETRDPWLELDHQAGRLAQRPAFLDA